MKKILVPVLMAGLFLFSTNVSAYEVQKGDTLSEIADNQNISLMELASKNPAITDLNMIYIGQEINTGKTTIATLPAVTKQATKSPTLTGEKDLLARLVRAEAQGESFAGKVAIAVTVLNRVDSEKFPNSITAVITQPGQFTPVSSGAINVPADQESIKAVEAALNSRTHDGLFFYNPRTATNRWLDSRPTVSTIGNHTFKK